MKIALTGATGFIGSALARDLVGRGHQVVALVRSSAQLAPGVTLHQGDLLCSSSLESLVRGAEAVVHLGAQRERWGVKEGEYGRVNVEGTQNLLQAAKGVQRFVHISSVGVYGWPEGFVADETTPLEPATPYGRSKVAAERLVRGSRLAYLILRPSVTYGPGDEGGFFPRYCYLLQRGLLPLLGGGANRLHLTYLDDVVKGVLSAVEGRALGLACNVVGPGALRARELAAVVAPLLGASFPWLRLPFAPTRALGRAFGALWPARLAGEPPLTAHKVNILGRDQAYDGSLASKVLGFCPQVSLEEGARRTISWLRERGLLRGRA